MLELSKEDVLDKETYLKIAKDICLIDIAESKSRLARLTGNNPNSTNFRLVYNFLKQNNFIIVRERGIGKAHQILINYSLLSQFLREGRIVEDYIRLIRRGYEFKLFGIKLAKPHYI